MFFPRVVAFDRLRGRFEMFAPCGVAAGMIARCDEALAGVVGGRRRRRHPAPGPAAGVERAECRSRAARSNAGINLLQSVRIAPKFAASPRTLASGSAAVSDWRYLSRAPPGAVRHDERRARHALDAVRAQCAGHLDAWRAPRSRPSSIRCTPKARSPAAAASRAISWCATSASTREETMRAGKINLAFGFAATQAGRIPRLHRHAPAERLARARSISVNRFANYSPSVDLEIESSILRGLVPSARHERRVSRSCVAGLLAACGGADTGDSGEFRLAVSTAAHAARRFIARRVRGPRYR